MISAVVLAAGLSSRMGQLKPLLPFGESTVIEQIVSVLDACSVEEILVVTGYKEKLVADHLEECPVSTVFNPDYESGEMFSSIQTGLRSIHEESDAALIVLGDQPAIEAYVVEKVIFVYLEGKGKLVIPSYKMRRGHPILIDREHWQEILDLDVNQTLRDFFKHHNDEVFHIEVSTPSVLRDMDTKDDYRRELAYFEAKN